MFLKTSGAPENVRHDLPEAFGVAFHGRFVRCRLKNRIEELAYVTLLLVASRGTGGLLLLLFGQGRVHPLTISDR